MYYLLTAANPFETVSKPIVELLDMALMPALAKAEEPQDREKAKNSLKNAIVGFVLIFVLIVVLKLGMGAMKTWMENATKAPAASFQAPGSAVVSWLRGLR